MNDAERRLVNLCLAQPSNSRIVVNVTADGLTFDFPSDELKRLSLRQSAWVTFEIAIFLLVAAVAWFAVSAMIELRSMTWLAMVLFAAGIFGLLYASRLSWAAWSDYQPDEPSQLAIVGKTLARTLRDYRKQTWHNDEIRKIDLTDVNGANILFLELHTGEKDILLKQETRAELDWIAALLRQGLGMRDSLEHAIQPDRTAIER